MVTDALSQAAAESGWDTEGMELPFTVTFRPQTYTVDSFTNLMQDMEALLVVGLSTPRELLRLRSARQDIAKSVGIEKIYKESPLEIEYAIRVSVEASLALLAMTRAFMSIRRVYAKKMREAAEEDAARMKAKLEKIARRLVLTQLEGLSKKKRKRVVGDKDTQELMRRAVRGLLNVESVDTISSDES